VVLLIKTFVNLTKLGGFIDQVINQFDYDTPPSSLMDSTASPKKKTTEGKGVGVRSLVRSTLRVEGRAEVLRWD
jgi:hypothetical protein